MNWRETTKARLKELGYSHSAICRATGLSQSAVSMILKGNISIPKPEALYKWGKALGYDYHDLHSYVLMGAIESCPEIVQSYIQSMKDKHQAERSVMHLRIHELSQELSRYVNNQA